MDQVRPIRVLMLDYHCFSSNLLFNMQVSPGIQRSSFGRLPQQQFALPFSSRSPGLKEVRIPIVNMKDGIFCQKTQELFASFTGEKYFLVQSIGFGGLLKLPTLQPVDASFALWLLENLDTTTMSLFFEGGLSKIGIRDVDVHLVLGIPYQGRAIKSRNNVLDFNKIVRTHLMLPPSDKPVSIDEVELVLRREYTQSMTNSEQVAFKVAVVLFASTFFVG